MGSIYKRSGYRHWYASYLDSDGNRCRESTGTSDKSTANQVLASLEVTAAQKRIGVFDDSQEITRSHQSTPLTEHIEAYFRELKADSAGDRHIRDEKSKLLRLASDCDWQEIRSITIESVIGWLTTNSDFSDSTRKSYARVAKSFTAWANKRSRLARDPLTQLPAGAIREKTFHRRALREDEWHRLRAYLARATRVWRGLTGADRSILYELSLVTGLRVAEIQSLRVTSLHLEATRPFIRLKSTDAKNKKGAEQFLTQSLTTSLKAMLFTKPPGSPLFVISDPVRLAEILRDDCKAARSAWLDEPKLTVAVKKERMLSDFLSPTNHDKETLDFHSLRHTCGAWLALRGVHPKAIQRVMRHSTITLTLDTYGHLFPEQEDAAIAALESASQAQSAIVTPVRQKRG